MANTDELLQRSFWTEEVAEAGVDLGDWGVSPGRHALWLRKS